MATAYEEWHLAELEFAVAQTRLKEAKARLEAELFAGIDRSKRGKHEVDVGNGYRIVCDVDFNFSVPAEVSTADVKEAVTLLKAHGKSDIIKPKFSVSKSYDKLPVQLKRKLSGVVRATPAALKFTLKGMGR